jgi:mRNA interferase MazF
MGRVTLRPGTVALVDLGATVGREQSGIRPAVVIASTDFSEAIDRLTIVVPCTTRYRGWDNHVLLQGPTGANSDTYAMTEQPRTISSQRILRWLGNVDNPTMDAISRWVQTWLEPVA